ncbi:hypothetical protein [Methylobacterium indicum]|uniref:Uncharacterized protein n=1 Tax=Methylobacterium indicum TaxID=1775910 RepID=A0A8H8X108_9HYPH|nr:hypothetical protein [Methylobacterium indicum]BCM88133.1 hypothetical protein mvi_65940 [Methylobacterium indicum]
MHFVAVLFALAFSTAPGWAATKEECRKNGPILAETALKYRDAAHSMSEPSGLEGYMNEKGNLQGAYKAYAERRAEMAKAAKAYADAMEDFSYQLNVCAR